MGPHHASDTRRAYKTFAWQGISLTIPSSWELVFTQGKHRAGHVRLADRQSVRLEVRWQRGQVASPPSQAVDSYVARLARRATGEGAQLSVQRNLKLASPAGQDVECYRWVADSQSLAMVSRCRECGGIVHVQLTGRPGESLKGLARTVFASLSDHSDGAWQQWRFFDLEFQSPADLPLARKSLQSGCIRMTFARRQTRLHFVRVSLAQVLLADKSLEQWFKAFYAKPLRRRSFTIRQVGVNGHGGLEVEGRAWRLVNPMGLLGRPRIVRGSCWHCEQTNRLFICCFDGPAQGAEVFPQALAGFRCCDDHPGAAG
jgi:hypothetical protein